MQTATAPSQGGLGDLVVGYTGRLLAKGTQHELCQRIKATHLALDKELLKLPMTRRLLSEDPRAKQALHLYANRARRLPPRIRHDACAKLKLLAHVLEGARGRDVPLQTKRASFKAARLEAGIGIRELRVICGDALPLKRCVDELEDKLLRANIRLTATMAKRSGQTGEALAEMLSEGREALYRAVQGFDPDRGFEFSTYACRAILKAYSRFTVKQTKLNSRFVTSTDLGETTDARPMESIADPDQPSSPLSGLVAQEELAKLKDARFVDSALEDTEQAVLALRFGTQVGRHSHPTPLTLEEAGKVIGVTKERVRQIQNKAFEKMREALEGAAGDEPSQTGRQP